MSAPGSQRGTRASPSRSGWLLAGRVGRPHGLDGSFHVLDGRAPLLHVGACLTVAGRTLVVERRAGPSAAPIVRLAGCRQREHAAVLRGAELLRVRSEAPALDHDEWYAEELEGCAVSDGGCVVGRVVRLLALPSCEALEVERAGVAEGPLLVPLVSDAVRAVDIETRSIDVSLRFLGET